MAYGLKACSCHPLMKQFRQNIIFHEIAPNFTYSQFFKYNWNFLDKLLLPCKFYGKDM